ncbi:MAG: NACHT domain-containing protein, partial [Desulfobacterales bacterium]|nr:NACHT domain-containing protein [Desulfobacterales bacterium]
KKELELLDSAWKSDETHVVSLVAWGGVGKSTLVNKWLEKMGEDNFRGARAVFAWSFYSQGTGERVTSADQFIREALEWFGDPAPDTGSTWNKGKRLAGLVQKEKTLLILDGLEPLQSPHEFDRGKLKDPALETLVTGLAKNNPGLCVITTREKLAGVERFKASVRQMDLERISVDAGRALLRVAGARG